MASGQDVVGDQQYQSDENILCDDCDKMYSGDCPEHGPLEWIKTTQAVDSKNYTPCIASLPDGLVLKESGIPGNEMGVFAARLIYKRTMFGPFDGKEIVLKDAQNDRDLTFAWDLLQEGIPSCILDGSDEKHSNWMRFVTYARDRREQNLIAFQYRGQIFYRTYRDVYPGEELMVWYEDEYTCSLDELQNEYSRDQMPEFACQRCRLVFAGSTYLYKHHKFRCPDGPLLSTYGARTTGLVGALFRLPVAIANDSWSTPVTNNENKPRSETESHHGRRKRKPRKLPRPSEIEETWNPEQPFGPPQIAVLSDIDAEPLVEPTTVLLPPETQTLNANAVDDITIEIENNNTNYLKRLTSDEITPPQLEKKPKLDNDVVVEVDEHEKYPYECGSCGKTFARPTWWAKHESGCFKAKGKENQGNQANSPVQEQGKSPLKKPRKEPYICSFCAKSFACPSWRDRHEKTHTKHLKTIQPEPVVSTSKVERSPGERSLPHVCGDCGKGFEYPSRLARHRRAKHPPAKQKTSDPRKHVCRDCGRGFAVPAWLTRHRMKAHNNSFAPKKHMCGVCGRSFAVASWLARHRKVHENESPAEQQTASSSKDSTSTPSEPSKKKFLLPWVCGDCGIRFKFISWLKRHQKNNKHSNGYFDRQDQQDLYKWGCDQPGCDKAYKLKHHLSRHKLTHFRDSVTPEKVEKQEEPNFVCKFCGKEFMTKRMFTRHEVKHSLAKVSGKFECSICNKVFDTKDLLERHFKRIHGNEVSAESESRAIGPPYSCRYCSRQFNEPLAFGRHIAHHKKRERTLAAKEALGSQRDKTKRDTSVTSKNDTSERDKPKRDTSKRDAAKYDKPAGEYPYECDECGRRFAVSFWLTRHKAEHENDHPHQCDECGRSFAVAAWLTRHKREHETVASTVNTSDDNIKPEPIMKGNSKVYKCDICGMEFTWPSWLLKHRKLHKLQHTKIKSKKKGKAKIAGATKKIATKTENVESYEGKSVHEMFEMVEKDGVREYECKACKKTTIWHTGIIYHIRVHHTHEKPFKCKVCSKAFHMSGDLTKHNRRHTGEKPHYCRYCKKSFETSQQVKKHEESHTKSSPFHCKYCGKGYRDRSSVWRHIARKSCPGSTQATQSKSSATSVLKKAKKTLRSQSQATTERPEKQAKLDKQESKLKQDKPDKQDNKLKHDKSDTKQKTEKQLKQVKPVKQEKTDKKDKLSKVKTQDKKIANKKSYLCKNCNKTFPNSDAFKAHIKIYKKNNQIVCEYCGKCWVRTADLKRHLRVHTGERPYVCPDCGLGFKVSDALKRHMIKLHPKSTKKMIVVKVESLSDSESKQQVFDDSLSETTDYQPQESIDAESDTQNDNQEGESSLKDTALSSVDDSSAHEANTDKGDIGIEPGMEENAKNEDAKEENAQEENAKQENAQEENAKQENAQEESTKQENAKLENENQENAKPESTKQENEEHESTKRNTPKLDLKQDNTNQENVNQENEKLRNVKQENYEQELQESKDPKKVKRPKSKKKKVKITKHKCDYCGKLYSGPGNLARHVRLHTGEKPFKCKECGENFMRSDILTQHMGKHHYK